MNVTSSPDRAKEPPEVSAGPAAAHHGHAHRSSASRAGDDSNVPVAAKGSEGPGGPSFDKVHPALLASMRQARRNRSTERKDPEDPAWPRSRWQSRTRLRGARASTSGARRRRFGATCAACARRCAGAAHPGRGAQRGGGALVGVPGQPRLAAGDLEDEARAARLSPGLIRKLRRRLALSQAAVARLVARDPPAACSGSRAAPRPRARTERPSSVSDELGRRQAKRLLAAAPATATRRKVRRASPARRRRRSPR